MTRFIEAFDSVRHAPSYDNSKKDFNKPRKEQLLHSKIETLLSIVLGERLLIPEPYSFDSLGFIETAVEVLESKKRIASFRRNTAAISTTLISNPFVLCLMNRNNDYRNMIAGRLRKENFILSALPHISNKQEKRKSFADYIQDSSKKFVDCVKYVGSEAKSYLENLDRLDDYFSQPIKTGPYRTLAGTRKVNLVDTYVDWLVQAKLKAFRSDHIPYVDKLQIAFNKLKKNGIKLDNRSDIRMRGRTCLDDDEYYLALEYVDSSYNRVLAKSTMAIMKTHSTGEVPITDYVMAGEQLSRFTQERLSRVSSYGPPMSLDISPTKELQSDFKVISWEYLWDRIWEIVAQPKWQESVKTLHDAIIPTIDGKKSLDNLREELENALNEHLALVSKSMAPFVVEIVDGRTLKIMGMVVLLGLCIFKYIFKLHPVFEAHLIAHAPEIYSIGREEYTKTISFGEFECRIRESVRTKSQYQS